MKLAGKTVLHELSKEECAEWLVAVRPVHDEAADCVGADLIEQIHSVLGATN
jgi:C4-dicarboxylate-binding protein DctP